MTRPHKFRIRPVMKVMSAKATCLFWVIFFMILEFLPFPVLGFVLLYVVFNRPPWFKSLVERLYQGR
jgi:hypothetical protein